MHHMPIQIMQGLGPIDTHRAGEIGAGLHTDSDLLIGISDGASKIGVPIAPRNAPECQSRNDCSGCERITKLASGRVILIYQGNGDNFDIRQPIGAICTSVNQGYQSIFFKK